MVKKQPYKMPQDCEPAAADEVVIELEKGPDRLGRYSFTMFWLAPERTDDKFAPKSTRPDGLVVRAQCFFADPNWQWHSFRIVDRTGTWKKTLTATLEKESGL